MKKTQRFTEVCNLDICLPDYFTGYSFPVIAIIVHNNMTNRELSEEIQAEINATWDYLTNEDHGFTEKEMELFDEYCKMLNETPDNIGITGIEEDTECEDDPFGESVYAYFSLCKPVYKYGMHSLNA